MIKSFLAFFPWLALLNKELIKNDIFAGISVGILVLPQAIAFATIAGMPAEYGLYTAIFPVLIAALLGSSWLMISGPNIALVVMIPLAVLPFASIQTPEYISYVMTLTLMVGVIQILFALLGFAKLFIHFSHTVLLAITSSVGLTIIVKQVYNFTGVSTNILTVHTLESINFYPFILGMITLVTGFIIRRYLPRWPYLIIATLMGMMGFYILQLFNHSSHMHISQLGLITLSSWSFSLPDIVSDNFLKAFWHLLPWAFLIAMMGTIQSLLILRTTMKHSGQKLNMSREIKGQGLSNILGSFLSCFPSAGSFNRSASNIDIGAKTPLSAIVSVVFLIFIVFMAEDFIATVPMAVMAGLLMLVGISMIKYEEIKILFHKDKTDALLFSFSLVLTLVGGLSYGLVFGLILSMWSYFKLR